MSHKPAARYPTSSSLHSGCCYGQLSHALFLVIESFAIDAASSSHSTIITTDAVDVNVIGTDPEGLVDEDEAISSHDVQGPFYGFADVLR